ncbi:hypothetical protein J2S57_005703 [Kineosporia succinea]|uniref:Uncharacterized protein n=1 Tax=Kineosporia succinea TaxID=84632 RepID=A0ABT9PB72_9ACTN|nr:hypothetical protein [Kineosporia succinea]
MMDAAALTFALAGGSGSRDAGRAASREDTGAADVRCSGCSGVVGRRDGPDRQIPSCVRS